MDFLLSSNLIVGFILIQPILDLVTSLAVRNMELPITLGLVIRSLFMVYLCIYVLVTKSNNNKLIKYSKIALSMILIYITFFLVFIIFSKDRSLILIEVKGIIKSFYLPIVLCGLFVYNQKDKINISNKLLVLTLMIYTSTIFIATVTNTYFNSYNSNGYGSVGWFYAANEIGSIMAILIPFTISSLVNDTERLLNTLACAICIASTMFLGTKVPFLALGGTTVFIIIYYIILNIYNKFSSYYKRDFNLKRIILMMSTILISMILIFPFSPLYKNIQRNYGDIIQRIVNNISYNKVDQNTQIEDKDNLDPVSKDEIVTAVLSKRTIYADIIKQKFNNSSWIDKLFGIGYNVEIRDEIYAKKTIDSKQLELLQNLVRQLKDYYTSQMWGFNYTDTIGSVCQRFYNLTNDSSIRALFLFIILEVGISHNRFYVMGIGETLIRNVKNNLTEAMELYSLLKQQPVYLSRLDITKRDLPEILQPYCN